MTSRETRKTIRNQHGFTLFELVLVLVVLVMLATLSWPAIAGMLRSSRLRSSADQVRAAWGEARVEAAKSGEIVVFRYHMGGNQYRIERWSCDPTSSNGVNSTNTGSTDALGATGTELPEGIKFAESQAQAAVDQRTLWVVNSAGETLQASAEWSAPIVFYPDGTSSDGQVILRSGEDLYVAVRLRGLTGGSRASSLFSEDELTSYLQQ